MTNFLLRLFVKNHQNTGDPHVRRAIGTLSGWVGIACNLLLCFGKLLLGALTGAVSVTADALNNLSDASGSIVTLLGFRMAGKPADEHHPYGHARAEYLSGLGVAVLILFIGFELAKTSVTRIFRPEPVAFSPTAVLVLVTSIAVKFWMSRFNRALGKGICSDALLAAAADSRNDCITTAAVLLSGLLERFLNIRTDGFFQTFLRSRRKSHAAGSIPGTKRIIAHGDLAAHQLRIRRVDPKTADQAKRFFRVHRRNGRRRTLPLFQFGNCTGNGCLVLFTKFTQLCCRQTVRIPAHHHKALGMGAFQAVFYHFIPLNLLDILVNRRNRRRKLFKTIDHKRIPFSCSSTHG